MTPIDYFAWFVLIVIILSFVVAAVALAMLPGKIARKNNHPQANAINWAGWLGLLLTMGVVWVIAMIWANMRPLGDKMLLKENARLHLRVEELEAKLAGEEAAS